MHCEFQLSCGGLRPKQSYISIKNKEVTSEREPYAARNGPPAAPALALSRHAERLVDAHPDTHRDAGDRHTQQSRHQGFWPGSRRLAESGGRDRTRAAGRSAHAPLHAQRFCRTPHGGYFLDFEIDRERIARHGLTVGDVEDVILTAVGGLAVSETVEGRERYAISLRYAREFREDPETLARVLVPTPSGAQVPLAQLAELKFHTGPDMLRNEDGQLVSFVFVDVRQIGIPDYVDLARRVVNEKAALPAGYRIDWAGQFQYFERAKATLRVLAPLTLLIVFIMLLMNRCTVIEALIVLLAVPFSLIGAVWCLYLLDYNLSVAVWVGTIALAGLDAELGILMLLYLNLAYRQRQSQDRMRTMADLTEAIVEGAVRRLRPKLMTGMALLAGLAPIFWSTGAGADVMKRIAAPMMGGIASALVMVLVVFPAIYALWKGHDLDRKHLNDPQTS